MKLSFQLRFVCFLFVSAALLHACKPADDILPRGNYVQGALVVNEGAFLNSNASISFVPFANSNVQPDVFTAVNGRPLGDVAQSMTIHNDLGYVVVNNSNKIEVVDPYSMRGVATFDSLRLPRYAVGSNNLIFVSEWVDFVTPRGNVVVMNAANGNIVRRISVGRYPERMVLRGTQLFVASTNFGGVGYVYVINTATQVLTDSIATPINPTSLALMGSDRLWIGCENNGAGVIVRYNLSTSTATDTISMPGGQQPDQLVAGANNRAYFLMGTQVWQLAQSSSSPTAIIASNYPFGFYGLGYEPFLGTLYCGKAIGFSGPGRVLRYRESDFGLQDSVSVGIAPNNFAFVYN